MNTALVTNSAAKLLEGLPMITPATHGRYSLAQRVALRRHSLWGTLEGMGAQLGLTAAERLARYYEPAFGLRPVQQAPDVHGSPGALGSS